MYLQLSISKTDESIAYGSSFNSESYIQSAVDNEDGDIKDRVKTEGSVDCSKSGAYKIRYYVEDDAGNMTEKYLNVSVAATADSQPFSRSAVCIE